MVAIRYRLALLLTVIALTAALGATAHGRAQASNLRARPPFSSAAWVALDRSGNVYVLDNAALRVRKLSSSGRLLASWSLPRPRSSYEPWRGMVVDPHGYVYVLEDGIVKLSPAGRVVAHWYYSVANPGSTNQPVSIAVGGTGNLFAVFPEKKPDGGSVSGSYRSKIIKLSPQGRKLAVFRTDVSGDTGAGVVTVDGQGNLYIAIHADFGCNPHVGCTSWARYINKLSPTGKLLARWGGDHAFGLTGEGGIYSIAAGPHGVLYLAEPGQLAEISPSGKLITEIGTLTGGGYCGLGNLTLTPLGFAVAVGGSGNLFVTLSSPPDVLKLSPNGRVLAFWGRCPPLPPATETPSPTPAVTASPIAATSTPAITSFPSDPTARQTDNRTAIENRT